MASLFSSEAPNFLGQAQREGQKALVLGYVDFLGAGPGPSAYFPSCALSEPRTKAFPGVLMEVGLGYLED